MKTHIPTTSEVDVTHVHISVPVRYDEEDIPNDFPGRKGETWKGVVEIDTGKLLDWPLGKEAVMHMKVCDGGTYTVRDSDGNAIHQIDGDYVPHGLIPGNYGDYIVLEIGADGIITNWPKNPDLSEFERGDDED